MFFAALAVGAGPEGGAAGAAADTTAADTSYAAPADSLRPVSIEDSLGVPGTLKGETTDPERERVKAILERMGTSEVEGRKSWERRKNPRVALLSSMILPGLGQTYNGRRIKVGVMVGFATYYMGHSWLDWRRHQLALARRDASAPGSGEFRVQNALAGFYEEEARTFLWWSGATWLLGVLDAWIDAHIYDIRAYTPPPPPETPTPRAPGGEAHYITMEFGLDF